MDGDSELEHISLHSRKKLVFNKFFFYFAGNSSADLTEPSKSSMIAMISVFSTVSFTFGVVTVPTIDLLNLLTYLIG